MINNVMKMILLAVCLLSLSLLTSCGGSGGGGDSDKTPPTTTTPGPGEPGTTPPDTDTPPSNPEWVQNVKASVMEYSNKILLTWDKRTEVGVNYKIYRYESKASDAIVREFYDIETNSYDDQTSVDDTPYYYQVTWIKDNIEHGKDAPLVVGLYHSVTDTFEPNDTYSQAKQLTPGTDSTVYTFIFDDKADGSSVDTDWYYCENTSDTAMRIDLTDATNLTIKCFHDDMDETLNDGTVSLTILPNTTKYFHIEPTAGDGIGTYRITVQ